MGDSSPFEAHETAVREVRDGLSGALPGLYIVPIRHHSPACAWTLRALIREVRPARVLIEAPADFESHIDLILDPATVPPVAVVALTDSGGNTNADKSTGPRVAAYYPFCRHSPEYVALQEGRATDAALGFIDLPSGTDRCQDTDEDATGPVSLQQEEHFDTSAYVDALAARTGCRDGFELWDHLFEARIGTADWRGFFADVGSYCAGIRATTPEERTRTSGDAAREAHMAAAVLKAHGEGGPTVAVVGGFHAPALIAAARAGKAPDTGKTAPAARSYLIRYGYGALDALAGYAAGLPQPGYYDMLWERADQADGAPRWREPALDLLCGFARSMRAKGHDVAVPAQVEALRVAESLSLLRGRPGILRHDLIDAVRAAMVKGEASRTDAWTERFLRYLRGERLGDVPASAGSPPLVEDARARARAHRIDISDGERRQRRLDIRRKRPHLAASRFLHAMTLLETGFAARLSGPDFLNDAQTDRLFEEWGYAWSPGVEGRLIECAALADRLPAACAAHLMRTRQALADEGHARDLDRLTRLLIQGILAGLGRELAPFIGGLAGDIRAHGDFAAVARAFGRIHRVATSRGPMGAPEGLDLGGIARATYERLIYLTGDLPSTPEEAIAERLDALRLVGNLLADKLGGLAAPGSDLDPALFGEAVSRVADAAPPPEILGGVLAIARLAGRRSDDDILAAVAGGLYGSATDEASRIGVIRGILTAQPGLLWRVPGLLEAIDAFLLSLDGPDFLDLLPHLRLAFTGLNPRETDRLAERLAALHGVQAGALTADSGVSDADLARGLAIEKRIAASIAADGLAAWLGA